jgi:hypothetical protein
MTTAPTKVEAGWRKQESSDMTLAITQLTGLLGLIFGIVGTVMGVLNYLRDRANVQVTLQWDMAITPGSKYDPNERWGLVRVANVGCRPIFVSHVAIRLPKGFEHTHLVVMEGMAGRSLERAIRLKRLSSAKMDSRSTPLAGESW